MLSRSYVTAPHAELSLPRTLHSGAEETDQRMLWLWLLQCQRQGTTLRNDSGFTVKDASSASPVLSPAPGIKMKPPKKTLILQGLIASHHHDLWFHKKNRIILR